MRFKSSGLGPKELKVKMIALAPLGEDLLVQHLEAYDPVQWEMKAALERKDVRPLMKGFLQPAILLHAIRVLFYLKKNPKEPEDIMDKSL